MPETLHRSTGFTIKISKPIAVSTDILELNISDITTSYTHSISAFGGYDTCTFNINYNKTEAEKWVDRLFCHVDVYSPGLKKIWEGFINKITITVGGLSVIRGPFSDIGNRVRVVYSTVDTTTTPPIVGMRAVTAVANDTDSQSLYGVIEKSVSVGGATDASAEQIRDTWIADNSMPATSQTFNSSGTSSGSITVECLGYFHYLKLLSYNDTTSGLREVSAIISDVFLYETGVNSIFSTDLTGIQTPASPVNIARYTDDNNSALNRIKYCTSVGDANDARWLFGVYADRKPYYALAPTDVEYYQRATSRNQDVELVAQTPVMPYDVLPGKWLRYTDFLAGRPGFTSIRADPRFEFIEMVTFSAPRNIVHSGSKQSTMKQLLAKYGLAGASA